MQQYPHAIWSAVGTVAMINVINNYDLFSTCGDADLVGSLCCSSLAIVTAAADDDVAQLVARDETKCPRE